MAASDPRLAFVKYLYTYLCATHNRVANTPSL